MIRRFAALPLLLAFLVACSPQRPEEAEPAPSPGRDPDARAEGHGEVAPATLAGEWRVAGIDGADFDEPYGMGLSVDEEKIGWDLRCAPLTRVYEIVGQEITFSLPLNASEHPASPPVWPKHLRAWPT
jgi:hypothetical protein